MQFNFDLISDLHIETWDSFDWSGQATSPYCVIAGDVARDHDIVKQTLAHLGQQYQGVFYIDGNDEHRHSLDNLGDSFLSLNSIVSTIKNVVYLQDNVIIINGVAILATNGWWSYDMSPKLDYDQSQAWYQNRMQTLPATVDAITGLAFNDANYMINSVKTLQTHQDVRAIVIVTHTVPAPWIIDHDIDLVDTWRFNCMGNPHLQRLLNEDTENKIHTWCFGHYHKSVDRMHNGIRYVNNCRGRGNTEWSQTVFHPRRISVNI